MLDERLVHHHLKRPPPPKRRGYLRAATTLPTGSVKVARSRPVHPPVHPARAGPHDGRHHDTALSRTEVDRGRLRSCGRCGRDQRNDAVDTRSHITGDSGKTRDVPARQGGIGQICMGTRWHRYKVASSQRINRGPVRRFHQTDAASGTPEPCPTSTLKNPKPSRVPVRPTVHEPGDPGRGPGVTPGCGLTNR